MNTRALVVGPGNVGLALLKQLKSQKWKCSVSRQRNDLDAFTKEARRSDIVFITITTKDKGEAELAYIQRCCELGIPVITAAKGAHAYHFDKLRPYEHTIGRTATVGGGSGIMKVIVQGELDPIQEIRRIFNGTINFLCWACQGGMPKEKAVAEAVRLNLCEPGTAGLESIVEAEMRDLRMKTAIIFNISNLGLSEMDSLITPDDFSYISITENLAYSLISRHGSRFVVRISQARYPRRWENGFCLNRNPWFIFGSFIHNAHELFPGIRIDKERNAIVVRSTADVKWRSGPGAGPDATAKVMVEDALSLLAPQTVAMK